jgi:light-independent protochlorophyllide reductase subunit B
MANLEKLVEELSALTVLEAAQLSKLLEEKWGVSAAAPVAVAAATVSAFEPKWSPDAERELNKIPFFVRGKARRNTERFAHDQGVALITVETLYDAKAHFGR